MLRTLFALAICVVCAGCGETAEPEATPAVESLELIEKAITARGGKDALSKYQAKTVTSKGTITTGDEQANFTATWYFHYPNRYRAEYQLTVDGNSTNMIHVFNGEKLWLKLGDTATIEFPDHALKGAQSYFQVQAASQLVPLLDKEKYSVSSSGEVEVKGKKTIRLNVKNKNGLDVLFYFDPKTHLIVKQQYGSKHVVTGQDALVENYLSNYKKTNEVMEPMQWDLHFDGKPLVVATIESVQLDEQLDASLFEKPE